MIDPVATAAAAVAAHSPGALAAVFCAGAVTSIGPCIAPRYVAVAALTNGSRRAAHATLAFIAGLIGGYLTLGFGVGELGSLWSMSSTVYTLLALALGAGGIAGLIRAVPHEVHTCTTCEPAEVGVADRSLGAIFLLGAASVLVISPCCTPIVATIVATSTAIGQPLLGMLLLGAFACGHALPLLFAGSMSSGVRRIVGHARLGQAPAIVGAVLMLALGIYYGMLA
jgi:cytochrome c-type biogenesis protein